MGHRAAGPLIAIAALVAGWMVVEAAGWIALGSPFSASERVLLITYPSWQPDGHGMRYVPDTRVRTVAVYGDQIAYDVSFDTNDMGFIDHRDYGGSSPGSPTREPPPRRFAFVGDSFTAGFHSGAPWVPQLRDALRASGRAVEIYNLGVSGVGLPHFLPTLAGADARLDFDHLVFLFITDDLLRKTWRPVVAGDRIVLCPEKASDAMCRTLDSRLLLLRNPDADAREIRGQVRASGLISTPAGPLEWLERRSHVATRMAGLLSASRRSEAAADLRIDVQGWLGSLRAIQRGRPVTLLQIPELAETERGSYATDLAGQIRAAGFRFVPLLEECGFESTDYLAIDGHFNAGGYRRLSDCVARVLQLR